MQMISTPPHLSDTPTAVSFDTTAAWELSNQLILTVKLFARLKAQASSSIDLDTHAFPILFTLADGPRRVTEIADAVHSDPSTVSRHTATLAKRGLIDKVPDDTDRRVQRVHLTTQGRDLIERLGRQRAAWFEEILTDWAPHDVAAFRDYLQRFAGDIERTVRERSAAT